MQKAMKEAWLYRTKRFETDGTFGHLICEDFHVHTGELPWRNNEDHYSCIPPGDYVCRRDKTGEFQVYKIEKVPDRDNVEFHIGNWCGDVRQGRKSNSEACVLPGLSRGRDVPKGYKYEQEMVKDSGKAVKKMLEFFGDEPFFLHIEDKFQQEA